HVLARPGQAPAAGVHVLAPDPDDDARHVRFSSPWHDDDAAAFAALVADLLSRHDHESAVVRLDAVPARRRAALAAALAPPGYALDVRCRTRIASMQVSQYRLP